MEGIHISGTIHISYFIYIYIYIYWWNSFGSGGLHRPETAGEYKENFIDTLRSYKGFQISSINYKPRMSNRKLLGGTMGSLKSHPELRMTTSNYDEKHRAMMNNYKKYQREIDRRLARPKYRIIRQKLHV